VPEGIPLGRPFTHVYVERGAPTRDSPRFRARLSGYIYREVSEDGCHRAVSVIHTELGIRLNTAQLPGHFEKCSLPDLLNSITYVFRGLASREYVRQHAQWHAFVARAQQEENIGFRLDNQGGVHPTIDMEFGRARAATVAGLGLVQRS
jgi:hypothetical protein